MENNRTLESVQTEEGVPAEEGQASTTTEPTADSDGVISLDVTKKYNHPRRPGEEIPGDQLFTGYQRGLQYDKVQGDLHKTQSELETTEAENQALRERLKDLEANERIVRVLEERGIDPSANVRAEAVRTDEGATDDWYASGEADRNERAEALKGYGMADHMRRVVREVLQQELGDQAIPENFEKRIFERVDQLYSSESQRREANSRRDAAVGKIRDTRLTALRTKYPDANDTVLNEIVNLEDGFLGKSLTMIQQSEAGDEYAALESYLDGLEQNEAALDKRVELLLEQRERNAERERDAEVESLSAQNTTVYATEEEAKPVFRPKDVAARKRSRIADAKNKVRQRLALKSTGINQ